MVNGFDQVTADDTASAFAIEWNGDSLSTYTHSGQDSSWDVVQATLPTSSDTANTSFLYVFRVQITKAAKETQNGAKWRLGVKTTDKSGNIVYTSSVYDMNWYGDIIVPEGHVIVWQSVFQNQDFSNPYAKALVFTEEHSVQYICNGAYSEKVRAETMWMNQLTNEPASIARNTDAAVNNSFALAIDTTDSYNSDTAQALPTLENEYAAIRTSDTGTMDVDVNADDYYMYIKQTLFFHVKGSMRVLFFLTLVMT